MPAHYSYTDYLGVVAVGNLRYEFLHGQIYPIFETPEHAKLAKATERLLQLPEGHHAYTSDLRIRTPSGLTTYADLTIVSGATVCDGDDKNAVTNPITVIEVLTRPTEMYARDDKFEHYKTIQSLHQVVFVGYRDPAIEVWSRGGDGTWSHVAAHEGEMAELAIGARIDVSEVYR